MPAWAYYRNERIRHAAATATLLSLEKGIEVIAHLSDLASTISFKEGYRAKMAPAKIDRVGMIVNLRQRGWSYYHHRYPGTGRPCITLDRNALNLCVIVHEWAHHSSRRLHEAYINNLRTTTGSSAGAVRYRFHDSYHRELVDWGIAQTNIWLNTKKETDLKATLDSLTTWSERECRKAACHDSETFPKVELVKNTDGTTTAKPVLPIVVIHFPKPEVKPILDMLGTILSQPPVTPEVKKLVDSIEYKLDNPREAFYRSLPDYCNCPKCGKDLLKSEFGVRVVKRDSGGVPTKMLRQSWCSTCRSKR